MALTIFTNATSPIIIHSVVGSFSHGNNLYPTAKTSTKSAKLSNLAPNLLSTPHRLARKPSSISVVPAIRREPRRIQSLHPPKAKADTMRFVMLTGC